MGVMPAAATEVPPLNGPPASSATAGGGRVSESPYPKRESHFAHRFIRLMARTCLANLIGPEACWLLTIIVMIEDAKRYSGGVTFYAQNLADQCGFSISSMERFRKRAVEAGWLHHVPGAKRRAATYWVLIPVAEQDKPDGPSDEGGSEILRQPDGESGEKVTEKAVSNRLACDGESGEHVTDLQTSPSPKKKTAAAVPVPPELDTPEFRSAWAEWMSDRAYRKKPLTALAAEKQLRSLAPIGPKAAVDCINDSIANTWTGLFPDKFRTAAKPSQHPSHDYQAGEKPGPTDAPPMSLNGKGQHNAGPDRGRIAF